MLTWAVWLPLWVSSSTAAQDADPNFRPPGLEQLRRLGEIELSANREAPPTIRNIGSFAIDSEGRFVFLRWGDPDALVVLDGTSGEVVSEIAVPDVDVDAHIAVRGADRVFLTREDSSLRTDSIGFTSVNLITQEITDVSTGPGPARDGPWVDMTWLSPERLITSTSTLLRCWTASGHLVWSLMQPDPLANVDAICTTTNGRIAVLDARGEVGVQFIYPEGWIGPYIHLKEAWGRESIYPRHVLPAADGGLWIVDCGDEDFRLVRTDAHCRPLEEWKPRYPNGGRIFGEVGVGPTGDLWMLDDRAFVRVGPGGVIDRVVGENREKAPFRLASMVRVGTDGRIYAAEDRDHSVRVFDDAGREIRVLRPSAYEKDGITPRGLGDLEWVEKRWFPVGATSLHWEVDEDVVKLVDPVRGEMRSYRDAEWPDTETEFGCAATSPDGRLAGTLFRRTKTDYYLLHVFILDPSHEEAERIVLPGKIPHLSSIAFDGKRLALANYEGLEIFDSTARSLLRVSKVDYGRTCGMAPDMNWRVDFARGGSEIWLREGDFGTKITRYAMP